MCKKISYLQKGKEKVASDPQYPKMNTIFVLFETDMESSRVLRYLTVGTFLLALAVLAWNSVILVSRSRGGGATGVASPGSASRLLQEGSVLGGWEKNLEGEEKGARESGAAIDEEAVAEDDNEEEEEKVNGDEHEGPKLCPCPSEEEEKKEEEGPPVERRKECDPVQKVAFAKTHKTGSSTVQNILLRYGVKHDLVFAMPPNSWMFHIIDPLNSSLVLDGPWRDLGFDIFAFHCRWNYTEVNKMVPGAQYITILRDPLWTFESNYVYMGAQNARKADLNQFAERFAAKGEKRNKRAYVGQNNLLWDLGVNVEDLDNMDVVDAKIKEIDEKFELVMMMERFEESLVLFADAFCWPLEEVTYIKQNERVKEIKNVPTNKTREIMREWLRGDYKVSNTFLYVVVIIFFQLLLLPHFQLYEHFMEVFQRKIDEYGRERMAADVARLREMNTQITSECITRVVEPKAEKKTGLNAVYTFETAQGKPWCRPYTARETEYCKKIREHQTHMVEGLRLKGQLL